MLPKENVVASKVSEVIDDRVNNVFGSMVSRILKDRLSRTPLVFAAVVVGIALPESSVGDF